MTKRGRMLPHLAKASRRARTRASVSTAEIAHEADVAVSTVQRFERARAWPRDPDVLISAYARLTHRRAKDIWREATDRWNGC